MTFYEGVIVWNWNGEVFNNVLHYNDNGSGPPDFQALTDEVRTNFEAGGMPGLVNDLTYIGMRWREDIPNGVGNFYPNTGGPLAGSAGASETVGQVAMIVRKVGVGSIRPHYGRIYVPCIASSELLATGLFNTTATAGQVAMWESIAELNDGLGAQLDMVIKSSDPTKPNTQPYTTVFSLVALGNPGTQRRRRRGAGT